jgi:uncharacterized protein HemX
MEFIQWATGTERILSVILLIVVIGLGRWFVRQGWPDIVTLIRERNEIRRRQVELANQAETERIRLDAENDRLLAAQFESLSRTFREWIGEVRSSIAIQQTHTNLLIHILENLKGRSIQATLNYW